MTVARAQTARSALVRLTGLIAIALAVFSSFPGLAAENCTSPGAHAKHIAAGFGCGACHPCAGVVGFADLTFSRGTRTATGTISGTGPTTTCSGACHSPLGAEPRPIAWTAGPVTCTACHTSVAAQDPEAVRSSHASHAPGATCETCHDKSQHTWGEVRLRNPDGTATASTCTGCHAGQGQTLGGEAPPLLVGWSDTLAGDFHGAREGTCRFDELNAGGEVVGRSGGTACPSGQPASPGALRITSRWWYVSGLSGPWAWQCDIETLDGAGSRVGNVLLRQPCPPGAVLNSACNDPNGSDPDCYPSTLVTRGFGGTLRSPYVRGQGALPCETCHDSHSSTNSFLFAAQVNGVAIPPGTIDRAGVGAQALCNACHQGDRHEVCKNCHRAVWTTDGEYSWFEGDIVDPVPDGSACFYCHGHEGLRKMKIATPAYPQGSGHPWGMAGQDRGADACSHCHSGWMPPPLEYAAPTVTPNPPSVTGVTATTATVTWQTNEPATTYVEYGVGSAGRVVGDPAHVYQHSVTLTGLTPATTYSWRIRSSDSYRNVVTTALQTFTTPSGQAVPKPDITQVSAGARVGTYSTTASLVWFPVTAPSGTAVEYEVQLASDANFTHLVNGALAGPGVPGSTVGDSGWIPGTATTSGGKPALSYPAAITNIPQDDCGEIVPNIYYWRVRARDQQGNISDWSPTGTFGAFAGDPWC